MPWRKSIIDSKISSLYVYRQINTVKTQKKKTKNVSI